MSDSNKPPSLRRRPVPTTPSAVGCEWQQPQVGTAGAPAPPQKHPHRYRLSEEEGGAAGSSLSDAGLATGKSQDPMLPPGPPLPRHSLRGRAPAAETSEAADSISHPAEPIPARMSDFGPLTSDRTVVAFQPRQDERTDKPFAQSVSPSRWRRGSTSSRKASNAKEKRRGVLLSEWREEILRAEHERETAQQQDRERERERERDQVARQAREARAREEQDKKEAEQGNCIGRKELAERLERERDERYRDVEERREQRARETGQPRDYLAWGDDVDDLIVYVRGWRSSAEVAVATSAAYEHPGRDAGQPGVRRSAGSGSGARAAATRTSRPEQGASISGSLSDTAPAWSLGAGGGRG